MLIHTLAMITIPLKNVGYERPQWLSHSRWFTNPKMILTQARRSKLVYPTFGEHSRRNPILPEYGTMRWFDDGHETHNNMCLSTSVHRYFTPLAPIWFAFISICLCVYAAEYLLKFANNLVSVILLHWCQHFGHGSIGTKFSVRVLWWQWKKSIGVKILAMDRLKIKIK